MVFGSEEEDIAAAGRMILSIERCDNNFVATGLKVVEGAEPIPLQAGGYCVSILGTEGRELFSKHVILSDEILYDYLDAEGILRGGRVRESGPFCLVLPYFRGAETVEIRSSDGLLLLQQEIGAIPPLGKGQIFLPEQVGSGRKPAGMGEYLRVLTRDRHSMPGKELNTDLPVALPSAKNRAKGRITIPGIADYSLVELTLTFYERESGKKIEEIQVGGEDGKKLRSDGSFSIPVPAALYVVAASCAYYDPDRQGLKIPCFPNPLFVDSFDPKKDELDLEWDSHNLFRGRVIEKGGRSIRAEIWIFESKIGNSPEERWLLTVVQTDDAGNFSARLPNRKLVFVVVPNSQETSGEIIRVVSVKKSQAKPYKFVCRKGKKRGGPKLKRIWGDGSSEGKLNILMMRDAVSPFFKVNEKALIKVLKQFRK